MKAIIVSAFGDEDVLHYREAPIPEPQDQEVRVKIEAAGVNPVEAYIRSGQYGALPHLPYTPGNDGAGFIDEIGPGVKGLAAGQRVFIAAAMARRNTGTYAQYTVCDADCVWPLPDAVSFSEGAGVGTPGLAAANSLFSRAELGPGEVVLVHGGTGGVGTMAVQLARKAGALVFATAGSTEGEKLLYELGAHQVFNHKKQGYLDSIRSTLPQGPDVILEMLANVNLANDLSIVAKRGRIVVVGSRGHTDLDPRSAMAKDAAVYGMLLTNMPSKTFIENMFRLSAGLENGLRVVIGSEMPLEQASQAHRDVMKGEKPGKIVLIP